MLKMISFKAMLLLYLATFVCVKEDDILDINDDQWKNLLKGEWMIEFHASGCPAFWALQPVWEDLGSRSHDLGIKVARVDVTDAPGISARFKIVKPLTIFHAIDGEFTEYDGPRRIDDVIAFIEEKKYGNERIKGNKIVPLIQSHGKIIIAIFSFVIVCILICQGLLLKPPYGTMQSLSDRSRASRPASTASDSVSDSEMSIRVVPSSNEIDYKKLYEEEKAENKRLRETVQELRRVAKAKLERSVQVLYEEEKAENERLRETVQELRSELSDANAKLERSVQVKDKNDVVAAKKSRRRAVERRDAEEFVKRDSVKQIKCLFNYDD